MEMILALRKIGYIRKLRRIMYKINKSSRKNRRPKPVDLVGYEIVLGLNPDWEKSYFDYNPLSGANKSRIPEYFATVASGVSVYLPDFENTHVAGEDRFRMDFYEDRPVLKRYRSEIMTRGGSLFCIDVTDGIKKSGLHYCLDLNDFPEEDWGIFSDNKKLELEEHFNRKPTSIWK